MEVVARSCLSTALVVVAAVGAVTPAQDRPVNVRASATAYSLTAASATLSAGASAANVPANLINMVLSVPAWEVQAISRLADAMVATGSWQVWGPTNVFGFDEQDPPKLAAIVDMLIPIQPLSSVLGEQLNWWAKANLPMNAGCAATAANACPDPGAIVRSSFTVPNSTLHSGYRFPVVTNPFTGQPTSWSGQYVKLHRGAAMASIRDYLTGPPAGVETVTAGQAATAIKRLSTSVRDAFNPFVQNSQWFDSSGNMFGPVFRALAPVVCRSCNPDDPYDNPWLKNYPPTPAAAPAAMQVNSAASVRAKASRGPKAKPAGATRQARP